MEKSAQPRHHWWCLTSDCSLIIHDESWVSETEFTTGQESLASPMIVLVQIDNYLIDSTVIYKLLVITPLCSLFEVRSIKAGLKVGRKSFRGEVKCSISLTTAPLIWKNPLSEQLKYHDFNVTMVKSYPHWLPNIFQRYTTGVSPCSATSCLRRSCRGWSYLFWPPLLSPHSSSTKKTLRCCWRWPQW